MNDETKSPKGEDASEKESSVASSIINKIIVGSAVSVVSLLATGLYLYFTSIPSGAQVEKNTKDIAKIEKKVEELKQDVNIKIVAQNKQIKKTQNMICAMAITLVDDREKAARICKEGQ